MSCRRSECIWSSKFAAALILQTLGFIRLQLPSGQARCNHERTIIEILDPPREVPRKHSKEIAERLLLKDVLTLAPLPKLIDPHSEHEKQPQRFSSEIQMGSPENPNGFSPEIQMGSRDNPNGFSNGDPPVTARILRFSFKRNAHRGGKPKNKRPGSPSTPSAKGIELLPITHNRMLFKPAVLGR